MSTFVCAECKRVVRNPYEQFLERMEYRRVDAGERRLVFALRDVCRDCVDDIGNRRRNRSDVEQTSMF